jgi:hypothetical protein
MSIYIRVLHTVELGFYALCLAGLLGGSSLLVSTNPSDAARKFTRAMEFDYVSWTLNALSVKLEQAAMGTPYYFSEESRHQIVVDYLNLINDILSNENQLNSIYTNPQIHNPAADSLNLQVSLKNLYSIQRQIAPLGEAVLQEQISATLAVLGLTTGGQALPPVLFHITALPYNLIISPRDRIQQEAAISLVPDLSVDQQITLETQVDSGLNLSSLVVPVGGIGSYPTMVMRTTALDWLADTIAHEWIHNWLTLQPLGLNYETSPELRTMNETTASIAGHEIAILVLKRYYPELAASYIISTINMLPNPTQADFNFNAEMHTTRIHVDDLLANGRINEAETYMEQRRQFFWQNGYSIRKLNQAYFAFYGAYADIPGGPAGEDPVGPAVRLLRERSTDLTVFLNTIARMNSFTQLEAAVSP